MQLEGRFWRRMDWGYYLIVFLVTTSMAFRAGFDYGGDDFEKEGFKAQLFIVEINDNENKMMSIAKPLA